MPTENDVREAYEEGLKDGALAERQSLRAFTGLPYVLAPKGAVAEHLAYPDYERRLRDAVDAAEREAERLEASRVRLMQAAGKAAQAYDEALTEHRQDREAAGVFGKLKSVVTEPFLREKSIAEDAEARVQHKMQEINEHALKLGALRGEHASVSEWVDEMYAETMAAGQRRAEDRIAAGRDISSRRFKVFTMSEYLGGDERRRLRWEGAPEVPGGADFAYHWRRDGDDDPSYGSDTRTGNWRAVWIPENQEAALFISTPTRAAEVWLLGNHIRSMDEAMKFFVPVEQRQQERNSIALLMDAYTETYLKGK